MGAASTGANHQGPRRLTFLEKFLVTMNISLIAAILYRLFH